jgi:hypothetical protein
MISLKKYLDSYDSAAVPRRSRIWNRHWSRDRNQDRDLWQTTFSA